MRRAVRTLSSDGMTDVNLTNTQTDDNKDVIIDEPSGNVNKIVQEQILTKNLKDSLKTTMTDDVGVRIIGATQVDASRSRFPFCIVWTPLPFLTWLFPIIGHMGIAYSSGIIRDFAGPYHVSEDQMAFGEPTKYWVMDPDLCQGGPQGWDRAIYEASEEYKTRMHNIFCDNCHSHCAYALNLMNYKGSRTWNMVWLAWFMIIYGRYVSFSAFLKTWAPFIVLATLILVLSLWKY